MTRTRATVARCGTPSGYTKHYREGGKPCLACREANAADRRKRLEELKGLGLRQKVKRRAAYGQRVTERSKGYPDTQWWWACDHDHLPGIPIGGLWRTQDEAYKALDQHNNEHHPGGVLRPLTPRTSENTDPAPAAGS